MHLHTGDFEIVEGGTYEAIGVDGHARFAEGVRFRTTLVSGVMEAETITGNCLIIDNGTVHCSGDIHVRHIRGRGRLKAAGNIVCDDIDLTGDIHSEGDIRCSGSLSVNGMLFNTALITATTVYLSGVLKGHTINGRELEVRPLRSTMFPRFAMTDYRIGSSAKHINAERIDVSSLTCMAITADTILLRHGSMVESATCAVSIGIDRTSSVLLLNNDCQRIHLATA